VITLRHRPPHSDRRGVVRLSPSVFAVVALLVCACLLPAGARAHFVDTDHNNKEFFKPQTYNLPGTCFRASCSGPIDPITVAFEGGGQYYSLSFIQSQLQANFHASDGATMGVHGCNGDQGLFYRYWPVGSGPVLYAIKDGGVKANYSDATDLNMSTSPDCITQNHIRIWDDYDHQFVFGGARNKWAVGSIHHETRCANSPGPNPQIELPFGCSLGHQRDRSFEQQARNLGYELRAYGGWCVDKKWIPLPGSLQPGGDNGFDYSDGYLTRLSAAPVAGTTCGNG
jgi:hypothetical protein